MTVFAVTMACPQVASESVLVFLRPINPCSNYRIHAWQILTPSFNATEYFELHSHVSVDISSICQASGNPIISQRIVTKPGDLLHAVSPQELSPMLTPTSRGQAMLRLNPEQTGVRNLTNPAIPIRCNWYVGDRPVLSVPGVDWGMTCSFEFASELFFMVSTQPLGRGNYGVQIFSDTIPYRPPVWASSVRILVARENGHWGFDFKPES